jgi:DNA polymerase
MRPLKISNCKKCDLCLTRTNVVLGRGSLKSRILFIGEAPGYNEDKRGLPFVGRSGEILDEAIMKLGLKFEDYYITNLVKCRPSANGKDRPPSADEIFACAPWLERRIRKMRPKIIVTLGKHATGYILGKKDFFITFYAGRITTSKDGRYIVFPLIHPAATLYDPKMKVSWDRYIQDLGKELEKLGYKIKKNNQKTLF